MKFFEFKESDFKKIATRLDADVVKKGSHHRYEIADEKKRLLLTFEIYTCIELGKKKGNLINIYSHYGIHQLHDCSGYVISELLGEIIFFSESIGHINAVVISKSGGYSVYSNIDKSLLNSDLTSVSPEIMATSLSLSLIEPFLGEGSIIISEENGE